MTGAKGGSSLTAEHLAGTHLGPAGQTPPAQPGQPLHPFQPPPELLEARDERRLLNLQRRLSRLNLLIIDDLGFEPLSRTGAELLFEVFSQRYERGSIVVTTNLPVDKWTEVLGSERLTGALLNRLTHHVHILEMNGESYRFKRSRETGASQAPDDREE